MQRLERAAHLLALLEAGQRAHPRPSGRPGCRRPPSPAARRRRLGHRVDELGPGRCARRIAVHFCPALTVISVTSCLTYRSNSGVPGSASGPRIEQFSESASAVNRTPFGDDHGVGAQPLRGAADPVKPTTSCSVRWSSRSPALPATSCSEPSGSRPDSTISSTMPVGEVRGLAGRLDQAGHAGEEGRRRTSPAAPRPGS